MDHYQLFDLPRVASPEDIEDKYHLLVKKYHPDRSKSPDAHEKFIKIKEAYEILKDPQKRKAYDRSLPPEEKVVEAPLDSEDLNSQESDSDSPVPEVSDLPVSGPKAMFKSTTISYVPFKSSSLPGADQPASSSRSETTDWSKYVSSGQNPKYSAQGEDSSDKTNIDEADWSSVKVKYEGLMEEVDDGKRKKFFLPGGPFLWKGFAFTLVFVFFLATLSIVTPGPLKSVGLGSLVEFFDKVIFSVKS